MLVDDEHPVERDTDGWEVRCRGVAPTRCERDGELVQDVPPTARSVGRLGPGRVEGQQPSPPAGDDGDLVEPEPAHRVNDGAHRRFPEPGTAVVDLGQPLRPVLRTRGVRAFERVDHVGQRVVREQREVDRSRRQGFARGHKQGQAAEPRLRQVDDGSAQQAPVGRPVTDSSEAVQPVLAPDLLDQTRYRLARLTHLDRATRRVIRRYEHDAPGELVHVDIKKLGNIPDGGGHKIHGRTIGGRNSSAHRDPARPRRAHGRPNLGYSYLHNAVDDYSRLAHTEILPDETKETAAASWTRAHTFFQEHGITVKRVLTDNGSCYRSRL